MSTKISSEKPAAPYSAAARAGDLIFTSGHLPFDAETGAKVAGGITEQTHKVMQNLARTLEDAGSSMEQVVKATVLLRDRDDWAAMNEVYSQYLGETRPARMAITAGEMKDGALVEIEVVARAS